MLLTLIAGVLATIGTLERTTSAADSITVGLAAYHFVDTVHHDTIRAALWYPSRGPVSDTVIALQPLHVVVNGRLLNDPARRPLVVISHGTGGNQFGHWDTAEALARAGFIVATIRHAGDNSSDHSGLGTDRYLYGRPEQVSRLLDRLLADPMWGPRIDASRIGGLGYSAGGFTVLELLGGRATPDLLADYCQRHPADPLYCAGPLHGRFEMTGRYPPPPRDPRIRSAVLWAPAFSFLFSRAGLVQVRAPLLIVRAQRDAVVIEPDNVTHLTRALPRAPTVITIPHAIHDTFLPPCSRALARVVPEICTDPPDVSRAAIHVELNRDAVDFFNRTLRSK